MLQFENSLLDCYSSWQIAIDIHDTQNIRFFFLHGSRTEQVESDKRAVSSQKFSRTFLARLLLYQAFVQTHGEGILMRMHGRVCTRRVHLLSAQWTVEDCLTPHAFTMCRASCFSHEIRVSRTCSVLTVCNKRLMLVFR